MMRHPASQHLKQVADRGSGQDISPDQVHRVEKGQPGPIDLFEHPSRGVDQAEQRQSPGEEAGSTG